MISNKKISKGQLELTTGGGHYKDLDVIPIVVNEGVTHRITSNNFDLVVDLNMPDDFPNGLWYDNKLVAVNLKDIFICEVRFQASSSVPNGRLSISIDIEGTQNVIREETFNLHKTANTVDDFSRTMTYYTGSDFISNGGKVYLKAIDGNISYTNFQIIPVRIHKGINNPNNILS